VKGERPALSISASSIQASVERVEWVKGERWLAYLLSRYVDNHMKTTVKKWKGFSSPFEFIG
jgi:hypothetical protein